MLTYVVVNHYRPNTGVEVKHYWHTIVVVALKVLSSRAAWNENVVAQIRSVRLIFRLHAAHTHKLTNTHTCVCPHTRTF
jgi:hypothetical protein